MIIHNIVNTIVILYLYLFGTTDYITNNRNTDTIKKSEKKQLQGS